MTLEGNLSKLSSKWSEPIQYTMELNEHVVSLNEMIGKKLEIKFSGRINCVVCGNQTKKSFNHGFCYNCFQMAPQADESVFNPELSKAQFGVSRDMEWSEKNDLIDHILYLSLTNDLKVGVTRHHQIPTRWIDQGADAAIAVAKTPNRHIAGVMEKYLKQFYKDKTDWRKMLKNEKEGEYNLVEEKKSLMDKLPMELKRYILPENEVRNFVYPVTGFPTKVTSVNLLKTPELEGELKGIKGQYLYLDQNRVFNVRNHSGYYVTVFFRE